MAILYGGTVYYKTDIVFNNNTFDMKSAHPVMVLFTTDTLDENAYVLPMTSDKKRARDHADIYTNIMYSKESYLNLSHIIEVSNMMRDDYDFIDIKEYERVLKEFYNYQMKGKQDVNFAKIKDRVETILKMLESAKDNDRLKDDLINNTNLQRYLLNNKIMTDGTKKQVIEAISEMKSRETKENNGCKNIKEAILNEFGEFSTYIQKNSYLEDSKFTQGNSQEYSKFKQYYTTLQSKYPLLNVNQLLLAKVAMEYRDDTSQSKILKLQNIECFVKEEMKRNELEKLANIERYNKQQIEKNERYNRKEKARKLETKKRSKKNARNKRKREENKYGKFYGFD